MSPPSSSGHHHCIDFNYNQVVKQRSVTRLRATKGMEVGYKSHEECERLVSSKGADGQRGTDSITNGICSMYLTFTTCCRCSVDNVTEVFADSIWHMGFHS